MPASERIRKIEALIISHRDYGEADRLIRLYSLEHGKLTAIAKGARKIRSRKAAHIEPFTHSALVLARGQSFWIITQAETKAGYPNIRENLQKTARAAYVLELADKLTAEEQPERAIFNLIAETMRRIDELPDPFNAILNYELRILDFSGFRPDFFHCAGCHKEITPQDQYFSVQQGGAVCPDCASVGGGFIPVTLNTLKYLRHFQRSPYSRLEGINIDERNRAGISRVMQPFISSVTERKLNSPDFLNRINHMDEEPAGKDDIK